MIRSMTGFGRGTFENNQISVTVEIKSVNHRYFELASRLPKGCAFLEDKLKSICKQYIERGKVEASVTLEDKSEGGTAVEINTPYADALFDAFEALSVKYGIKNDVTVSSLAGYGELFTVKKNALPDEVVLSAVTKAANAALDGFSEMRAAEGEKLKSDVEQRLGIILERVAFVEERSPQTVKSYRERLEARIRELLENAEVDEQRLITETAIFADKIAVAEETVRLRSHIDQFKSLLSAEGAVGRKLDFIVQEMNREANTIGSKVQDTDIARAVVEIKAEIEKIREQIQNIE